MEHREYKRLERHLFTFENELKPIVKSFNLNQATPLQKVTVGMMQRLLSGTISLRVLLKDYQQNKNHHFAVSIIFRPLILDAMVALRLFSFLKANVSKAEDSTHLRENLETIAMEILSDGVVESIAYADDQFDSQFIDETELHSFFNYLAANFPEIVRQPNGMNSKPELVHKRAREFKSATSHYKDLIKDAELIEIARRLRSLYMIYSKYDHFGMIYFNVISVEEEELDNRIIASIDMLVNHYVNLVDLYQRTESQNQELKRKMEFAHQYLFRKHHNDH